MLKVRANTAGAAAGPGTPSAEDTSRTAQLEFVPPRPRIAAWRTQGLAASNFAVFTQQLLSVVETRSIPPDLLAPSGPFLDTAEAAFIRDVREDIDALRDQGRRLRSAKLCEEFIEGVGLALARKSGTRFAVFPEEEDTVVLVVHSAASKRQVSFEFGADRQIRITSIDEQMRRTHRVCGPDHLLTLGNAIAWLNHRS